MPLLSICIPCYGRVEYVRNTLKSIYIDNADVSIDDYEIIISDNNPEQTIKLIVREFQHNTNLKYYYTDCEGFMNSYYVLKYATGDFIKLHNSQTIFKKNSIRQILQDIKNLQSHRSLIFYTNGLISNLPQTTIHYQNFEDFMYNLSYWSSWSNGFCIWNEDLKKIGEIELNKLFPHTSIFLTQTNNSSYIINNQSLFDVQRIPKRGGHNKFQAFTIEYPSLIDECYNSSHISEKCRNHILDDILKEFLPSLLFNKYIARIETFDSTGYHKNIKKYFPKHAFWKTWLYVPLVPFKILYRKIKQKIK